MDAEFSPPRRFERFPVELTVVCVTQERRLADRAVNLSKGGARIETNTPLAKGTRHRFLFIVPDPKLRDTVIDVPATVAWSDGKMMGLCFERNCGGIDDYVHRLERHARSI